jgi:hypothetical protein
VFFLKKKKKKKKSGGSLRAAGHVVGGTLVHDMNASARHKKVKRALIDVMR